MTAKPEAGETVLTDNHRQTHEHSVSDAKFVIAAKTITTEDKAANYRL